MFIFNCLLAHIFINFINIKRELIKKNYDPNSKIKSDEIKILISTDVLAEGINLHRSNIVINYDLPWNPTKVLQRVGLMSLVWQ